MTNSREGTSVMTDSRELVEPVDSDAADMRRTSERPTEAPSTDDAEESPSGELAEPWPSAAVEGTIRTSPAAPARTVIDAALSMTPSSAAKVVSWVQLGLDVIEHATAIAAPPVFEQVLRTLVMRRLTAVSSGT